MQKIKDYNKIINNSNLGFAFIYFEKQTDMKDFKKFLNIYKSQLSDQDANYAERFGYKNMSLEKSTSPENIIWTGFNQKTSFDTFMDILVNIFLFFITIIMNPVAWAKALITVVNNRGNSDNLEEESKLAGYYV